jgi:hypothetical protein
MNVLVVVIAVASCMGAKIKYLDNLSCTHKTYRIPDVAFGTGPTISILTSSKHFAGMGLPLTGVL